METKTNEATEICRCPSARCDYRKGYLCQKDCECTKDPRATRAFQDREHKRITAAPIRKRPVIIEEPIPAAQTREG